MKEIRVIKRFYFMKYFHGIFFTIIDKLNLLKECSRWLTCGTSEVTENEFEILPKIQHFAFFLKDRKKFIIYLAKIYRKFSSKHATHFLLIP
jgi:hypothetical protein